MSGHDFYALLGVTHDASDEEIKSAYRQRVKQCHPDRGETGDPERFRRVREAYETLSNPDRRREYDRERAGRFPASWMGGFVEPLSPLGGFREIFTPPPADVQLDIIMSPTEALSGGRAVIEDRRDTPCPRCAGSGLDYFGWCSSCRGHGWLRVYERVAFDIPPGAEHGDFVIARRADGTGVRARIRIRG
ncbi:MAG TPA: DnaJ domain-containing protein [Vicinamibacteria bacterium]|nr:DnaJ domain-containing protein [Vicinamibacteria bacterium]